VFTAGGMAIANLSEQCVTHIERRSWPRLAATFPVIVRGKDREGMPFSLSGCLDDMSSGGFRMVLPVDVEPAAKVFAVVRMAEAAFNAGARVAIRGAVVRSEPLPGGCSGIAVRIGQWRFL
jgi:hypothetical protein